MDGYAVRFAETFGASERNQKRLKIGEQAVSVDTGDPMPDGFNAVINVDTHGLARGYLLIKLTARQIAPSVTPTAIQRYHLYAASPYPFHNAKQDSHTQSSEPSSS